MGHSTTRATEKFYGRRKNQTAIEKARAVWRKNDATESPEKGDSKVDSAPNATVGQSQEMGGQYGRCKLGIWLDKKSGQGEIRTRGLFVANEAI